MHLSLKKRIQKKKEKRKKNAEEYLASVTGMYFDDQITAPTQKFPLLKYLLNSVALFCACFGTLLIIQSSFRLNDINMTVVFGVCAVISLLAALMYVGKKIRIFSYLLILAMVIFLVFRSFMLINSGMSEIYNSVLKTINGVFDLAQLREFNVFVSNPPVTETYAACTVALTLMILLNIFISEFMSAAAVFIVTFPLVQIGMYFDFNASVPGIVMVVVSWFLVWSLKRSESYNGLTHRMSSRARVRKHRHSYGFITDPANAAQVALTMLLSIVTVILLLVIFIPQSSFTLTTPADKVKNATNDKVNDALSYGLSSLFPWDNGQFSTGDGNLSNTGRITFTGQTVFNAEMYDDGISRTYLRQFTADTYDEGGFRWRDMSRAFTRRDPEFADFKPVTAEEALEYDYSHDRKVTGASRTMNIDVVNHMAVPGTMDTYFTRPDGIVSGDAGDFSITYQLETEPGASSDAKLQSIYSGKSRSSRVKQMGDYYDRFIRNHYMEVPEGNRKVLDWFVKKYDLEDMVSSDAYTDQEKISAVVSALTEDYSYTLRPGRTPNGEDYVNYFLRSSKKGYCQHFASAATLLFRYLNIPARYVEGYVIDNTDIADADTVDGADPADFGVASGDADNVVDVKVRDTAGHAWVEYYEKDFGWTPVEVTLAQSLDDDSDSGIFGALSGIFGNSGSLSRGSSDDDTPMNQVNQDLVQTTRKNGAVLLMFIIAVLVTAYLVRMVWIVVRRRRHYGNADLSKAAAYKYRDMRELFKISSSPLTAHLSYEVFSDMLVESGCLSRQQGEKFTDDMEKSQFSGRSMNQQDFESLSETIMQVRRWIIRGYSFRSRLRYLFIDILW